MQPRQTSRELRKTANPKRSRTMWLQSHNIFETIKRGQISGHPGTTQHLHYGGLGPHREGADRTPHTHTELSAPKTKDSEKEGGLHQCQCLGCDTTLSFCKMLSLEETGQSVQETPHFCEFTIISIKTSINNS